MADSCRPVSRHGRYNATGPSSVAYGTDVASYGNVDYTPTNEMYTVNQPERPERPERPKTSRGRRRAGPGDMPPRPSSRRSNKFEPQTGQDPDHESFGRPASRVGFSPEADYRYSHDEFSRQIPNERRTDNSPCSSPDENIFPTNPAQPEYSPTHHANLSQSPAGNVDRLIVSPSNPQDSLLSKGAAQQSQRLYTNYSPQNKRQSPQYDGHTQYTRPLSRPSSQDYMNVSPIQRDEAQLTSGDIHHERHLHYPYDRDRYAHEGDAYTQSFSESPQYRNSPYRESPQYRNSPYRDSPHQRDQYAMGSSPTNKYSYGSSPPSYARPPPSQRPKSARPKTGRKKSARARHRHEEQETSQPQMCNTDSILHTGDPYGRPSSSLSRYKPLPAIGATTPRHGVYDEMDNIVSHTGGMVLDNRHDLAQFHPADDNIDPVCVEDIQGHRSEPSDGPFTDKGVPNVSVLTNLPQHLSSEIFSNSLANYENISEQGDVESGEYSHSNGQDIDLPSSKTNEPLDFLHELPKEPSENEARLLLAVKLPDGKRIQRYFSPHDQLKAVLDFAENDNLVKYRDYNLVCNAPRTTFTDVSQKILDTGLQDRTVLYLEEKDV